MRHDQLIWAAPVTDTDRFASGASVGSHLYELTTAWTSTQALSATKPAMEATESTK